MKINFINKFSLYAIAAGTMLSVASCEKSIQIEPQQSIEAASALNTRENIQAAITGAYTPLKSTALYGNRMITLPEALSDNGRATNKSGRLVNEARNSRGFHFTHWTTSYNAINRINLVLEAVPSLNDVTVTDAIKAAWVGELKFLRALYYFDLVRAYAYIPGAEVESKNRGGVPIILTPVKNPSEALAFLPARASQDEVYKLIYADLDEAVANLSAMGNSPARASKEAAQALYSRVALYRRDYQKVIDMASAAIATRGNRLLTPATYVNGWSTAVNPESLFEVTFASAQENIGVNESLQTAFTTLVIRGNRTQTGGFGDLVPTPPLLAALGIVIPTTGTGANGTASAAITSRSSDVRNLLFEVGTAGRGNPFVETTKYLGKNGAINLDNVPVFRVAELYLNRAEAYAALGNNVAALADVNTIRTNRGLTASAAVGTALMAEIMLQRRLEFAFEGHRFFDLKRTGSDIVKPTLNFTVAFTEDVILPAIPQSEVDGNPNLQQNSGY